MVGILNAYHAVVFTENVDDVLPLLGVAAFLSAGLLVVGLFVFRRLEPRVLRGAVMTDEPMTDIPTADEPTANEQVAAPASRSRSRHRALASGSDVTAFVTAGSPISSKKRKGAHEVSSGRCGT